MSPHQMIARILFLIALFLIALLMARSQATAQDTARELASSPRMHRIDTKTPRGLQELFQPTGDPLPFVSAHRGGNAELVANE